MNKILAILHKLVIMQPYLGGRINCCTSSIYARNLNHRNFKFGKDMILDTSNRKGKFSSNVKVTGNENVEIAFRRMFLKSVSITSKQEQLTSSDQQKYAIFVIFIWLSVRYVSFTHKWNAVKRSYFMKRSCLISAK